MILGTFPSIKSYENNFYYSHPKNQFWKILESIYHVKLNSDEQKIEFLKEKSLAIWDMIYSCNRINSLDKNLKDIVLHDIELLLNQYPNIKLILFTSKTAEKLYKQKFSHLKLKNDLLPSPSPAYCKISFEQKVESYKQIFIETFEEI